MTTKPTIGFIGLGLMGKPMARNILKAGFPLIVHNRSKASESELAAQGAKVAESPATLAHQVDILMTCLPDSPDVEQVLLRENGVLHGARPGLIVIDHSTIKPGVARKVAAELKSQGIEFLDAPVSGGQIGAEQATLTIMIGGDAAVLERVRPALEAVGKTLTHVGDSGAGQVAKCCNQIMVAAQMTAMAELLIFARKAGADPRKVVHAIRGGAAQCWTLDTKPDRLFAGNRQPGFKARMQLKDLGIVMETAGEHGMSLPGAAISTQLYDDMVQMGLGDQDNSALVAVFEKAARIQLT